MAQAFSGKFQAWTKETKLTKGQRIRPSKNATKASPLAVNPAFAGSNLENAFQPVQMKVPGKSVKPKPENTTTRNRSWDGKPGKVPSVLSWAVLATTCLLSVLALLLALLMFFGEVENPNCRCNGLEGDSLGAPAQAADAEGMSDKMALLEAKVSELQRKLGMQEDDIAKREQNMTIVRQQVQESHARVEVLEKLSNESKKHESRQVTKLLALQATLNLTRQEVTSLKHVWESVNATNKHVKNVVSTLNDTQDQLLRLSRVWADVNSTKDGIQQLRKATQNITDKMETRLEDAWENIRANQRCCSNITSSLGSLSEKLNATEKQLQSSDQTILDRLYSMNATLHAEVNAVSKMPGPMGPPGYNGSRGVNGSQGPAGLPGPKGSGNFSQCLYKSKGSTPISSGASVKEDVSVNEPNDKRIVGATCSTDDAEEYRLISQIIPAGPDKDKRQYKCKCAGRSSLMLNSNGKMTCFIHYWECPLVT